MEAQVTTATVLRQQLGRPNREKAVLGAGYSEEQESCTDRGGVLKQRGGEGVVTGEG